MTRKRPRLDHIKLDALNRTELKNLVFRHQDIMGSVLKTLIELDEPMIKHMQAASYYADREHDDYLQGWNDALNELRKRIMGLNTEELEELKEHEAFCRDLRLRKEWT